MTKFKAIARRLAHRRASREETRVTHLRGSEVIGVKDAIGHQQGDCHAPCMQIQQRSTEIVVGLRCANPTCSAGPQ